MQEVDRLGWAVTVPLCAGEYVLGVRASSEEAAGLLRELFADRLVPDATPPGNLSLWLAPPATDGVQDLHRLFVTHSRTLRTRSVSRMLGALWHELDARDARAVGEQHLAEVTALIDGRGRAHLLSSRRRPALVDDERRWQRAGFQLVERRWVAIDPQAGRVAVPPLPTVLTDGSLEQRIAALGVYDRPGEALQTGSWPIASWTIESPEMTLGQRLARAAGSVLDLRGPAGAAIVHGLAELLEGLPEVEPGWANLDELRDRLAQLPAGASP